MTYYTVILWESQASWDADSRKYMGKSKRARKQPCLPHFSLYCVLKAQVDETKHQLGDAFRRLFMNRIHSATIRTLTIIQKCRPVNNDGQSASQGRYPSRPRVQGTRTEPAAMSNSLRCSGNPNQGLLGNRENIGNMVASIYQRTQHRA